MAGIKPKFSSKTNNYTAKWLTNAMKSIGASYGASIKTISPNLYDVASAGVTTSRKIYMDIRKNKINANRVGESLKQNKYVKYMQTAYKNALTDIKTGNFDNQERMMQSMTSDTSDSVEEMTSGFSFGDDGADNNINVNVVDGGASSGIASLQSQMKAQSETSIKMQKASMDAYVAVNAASMQQIGQLGAEVVGHLTNISSQLGAIVQYNNDTMTRYIEASMTYFDKVGSSVEKMANKDDETLTSKDVMSGSRGGFNYGKYKEYVKQQFKDTIKKSNLGMIASLLEDDNMIKMAISNPMGFLTNGLTAYMMPKVLKTSLESMEETFNAFMPSLLEQLGDLTRNETSGWAGKLVRAFGNTFGIKNDREVNFKNAKIERGPIPFDGETKHAITEIITKELREQTGYLQIIAEHYKRDAKKTVQQNAEYWDWNTNSYQKMGDVTSSITQMMVKAISDNMQSSEFGKAMQGVVDTQNSDKAKAEVQKTLDEFYVLMEKETRFLQLPDLIKLVESTNGSPGSVKLIRRWLEEVKKNNPNTLGHASSAKLNAQTALKNIREEIKDNPTLYKLFDSEYRDLEDAEHIDTEFLKQLGLNVHKQRGEANVKVSDNHYDPNRVSKQSRVGKSYSEEGKTEFGKKATKMATSVIDNSIDIMRSIMNGDTAGVINKGADIIAGVVTNLGSKINKKLFGEKDERGYHADGIFSGLANGLTDMVNSLKYKITGNEYTDSKGKTHAKQNDTIIGRLTQVGDVIKDSVMLKLFGKAKDDEGKYVKKGNGVVDVISNSFKNAADSFKEFLFGERDENGKNTNNLKRGLIQNITSAFQKGWYGNGHKGKTKDESELDSSDLIGKAAMGTAAGGLLGYLVGGPIVGSMLGFATTVVRHSDKFKEFLFGKEDGLTLADGTKTKKQGLFGRVGNMLTANFFNPLKNELKYIRDDLVTTVKHDILAPISFAAEFFSERIGGWLGEFFNVAGEKIESIGGFFGAMAKKLFPGVIEGAGALINKGLHTAYEVGAKIIKAPGKLLVATVKALGIGEKIKAFFKPFSDMIKGGLKGIFKFTKDVIKDTLHLATTPFRKIGSAVKKGVGFVRNKIDAASKESLVGKIRDNLKEQDSTLAYNDNLIKEATGGSENGGFDQDSPEARDWLAKNSPETLAKLKSDMWTRMKLNSRQGKLAHTENKELYKMGKAVTDKGKLIAKWTNNQFSEDSDEARSYLLQHNFEAYQKLMQDKGYQETYSKYKDNINKIKGNTSGTAAQIAKGDLIGLSEEGKQTTLLAKIWDIMFKNQHDNKSEDDIKKEQEDAAKPKDGQKRRVALAGYKGYRDEIYNEATGEWEKDTEQYGNNKAVSLKDGFKVVRDKRGRVHHYEDAEGNRVKKSDAFNYEDDGDKSRAKKEDAQLHGSYALRDIADFGSFLGKKFKGIKNSISNVLADPERQHAKGGTLKAGLNLVGEEGPELVNFKSGEVKTSDETSSVIDGLGEASSDEARKSKKNAITAKLNKAKSAKEREELADEQAAIAKDEADDMRSDSRRKTLSKVKDAATMMKEKAEEKFRKALLAVSERTATASEEGTKTSINFSSLFSKIFSKNGLITTAIIGGLLFLKKYAPDVITTIGKVLKGIGSAIGWVLNLFNNRKDSSYNTDGKSGAEVAGDMITNAIPTVNEDGDVQWNPLQLQQDGGASSMTMPVINGAGRVGLNIGNKYGYKTYKNFNAIKNILTGGSKTASEAGSGVTAVLNKNGAVHHYIDSSGKRVAASELSDEVKASAKQAAKAEVKSGVKGAEKAGAKVVTEVGEDIAEAGVKGAEKAGAKIATETVEGAAKSGAESGRKLILEFIEKFWKFITEKFESKFGVKLALKGGSKVGKGALKTAVKKLAGTKIVKIVAVITGKEATEIATAGISTAVFVTLGALNGATGAAKLFKCKSEDVDATMIAISTIFGALAGTTLGSVIDIAFTAISPILGVDILNALACAMYNKIVGEESDKAQKLASSQEELTSDYEKSRDAKIEEQYKTQKAAGLTTESFEDFKANALAGNENVNYKSFDDYNTDVNGSAGDKIVSGVVKGAKAFGHGVAKGWTTVFGGEKTYADSNGNTYTKNSDGTYQVKDKDGNDLGYVSKDAIPQDATVSKSQGLVSKAWNGVKDIGSQLKSGELFSNLKDTFSKGFSSLLKKDENYRAMMIGFIKGDVDEIKSDSAEDSPFKSLIEINDKINQALLTPIRGIVGIGKKIGGFIGDKLRPLINVVKNVAKPSLSYITGENESISFDCPDDNPGKPIIDFLGKALQITLFPVRGIVGIGKKIGEFIGKAVTAAKDTVTTIADQSKGYVLGENDSIKLTDKTGISPLGALGGLIQYEITPIRWLVSAGKWLGGFIGKAVTAAKDTVTTIADQSKGYILGDNDSIELTDESGISPLGALGGLIQYEITPIRWLVSIGKKIGNFFGEAIDDVKDISTDIVDQSKKYLNDETDEITISISKDNMFHPMGQLIVQATQFILAPFRIVFKVFNGITNFISSVKEKLNNVWTALKGAWDYMSEDHTDDNANSNTTTDTNTNGGNGGFGSSLNGSTYYSQNDPRWKNLSYSLGSDNGTMGDTGCGPTAAAMAFSDVTGKKISPMAMANLAKATGNRDNTGTNWNFINDASNAMGMNSTQIIDPSASTINAELDSGNPVILSGTSNSSDAPYTSAGHYVVAVGKDSDGNLIINDPRGAGYSGKYNINNVASHTGSSWTFGGTGRNRKSRRGGKGFKKYSQSLNSYSKLKQLKRENFRRKWMKIVKAVKEAIAAQKPGYNQSGSIRIGLDGDIINVRTDCSGYVSACLHYMGIGGNYTSLTFTNGNSTLDNSGFKKMSWHGWDSLEEGDIIARHNGDKGHVEIFSRNDGSTHYVYSCGSTAAINSPGETSETSGEYTTVWRPGEGNLNGVTGLDSSDSSTTGSNSSSDASISGDSSSSSGTESTWSSNSSSDASISGDSSSSSGTESTWSRLTSYLGNFFTSFADKAMSGLATGNWDSDYSSLLSGSSDSSSDSGSTDTSGSLTSVTPVATSSSEMMSKTWKYLTNKGLSNNAVAGLMGNLYAESGLKTNNLQNSYESKFGADDAYTAKVDNGSYTNFGNDSAGYGLAQWTSAGRKQGLWDAAKAAGKSISDPDVQLDYLWQELSGGYSGSVLSKLQENGVSLADASNVVLHKFEAPADQSAAVEATRAGYAQDIYNKMTTGGAGTGPAKRNYANTHSTSKRNRGGRGAEITYGNLSSSLYSIDSNASTESVSSWTRNINKDDSINTLVYSAIQILGVIANNTGTTSTKLDVLKNLTTGTGSNNVILAGGNDATTNSILAANKKTNVSSNDIKYNAIAKGGY